MAKEKSLLDEMRQIQLAIELIELGARLQVLETETNISRGRLIRLYKEIHGASPPKGMLPFSTDWFVTWLPNIHSSLFYNFYRAIQEQSGLKRMPAIVKSYKMYLEQISLLEDSTPVLGLTRAWTLVRFFENDMMQMSTCTRCDGHFVAHAHSLDHNYVCGICNPPSRAGKTRRAAERARRKAAGEPMQKVQANESASRLS